MTDEEVLDQYTPLIKYIAAHTCYSSPSLDDKDLCQVGKMALIRAYREYDPSCGGNLKTFLSKSIRRAIYNEAARFLGIFTVDHRITPLISKINKLYNAGKTDAEIAKKLDIEQDKVRDLRFAYKHRVSSNIDDCEAYTMNSNDIVSVAVNDDLDEMLLKKRILGNVSIQKLSNETGLSKKVLYEREAGLKTRIRRAVEDTYEL